MTFEANETVSKTDIETDSDSSILSQDQSVSKASSDGNVPNVMPSMDQSNFPMTLSKNHQLSVLTAIGSSSTYSTTKVPSQATTKQQPSNNQATTKSNNQARDSTTGSKLRDTTSLRASLPFTCQSMGEKLDSSIFQASLAFHTKVTGEKFELKDSNESSTSKTPRE